MAKRTTNVGVLVEYIDDTNKTRATNIGVQVEYIDTINVLRLTAAGVQVEYAPGQAGRIYGPPAQMM